MLFRASVSERRGEANEGMKMDTLTKERYPQPRLRPEMRLCHAREQEASCGNCKCSPLEHRGAQDRRRQNNAPKNPSPRPTQSNFPAAAVDIKAD